MHRLFLRGSLPSRDREGPRLAAPRLPRTLPALLQLGIQMAEGGELTGEFCVAGGLHFTPRRKIPAPEQVGGGDHRSPHGTVLIRTLRPCEIPVHPKIEAHETYSTTLAASSCTASSRSSLRKGFRSTRQVEKHNARSRSGLAAMYRMGRVSANGRNASGLLVITTCASILPSRKSPLTRSGSPTTT